MNIQQFNLDELEVEFVYLKDIARCLLHTIIFNRAFGVVTPKDVEIDFLDFVYVCVDDPTIERDIEDKVELFCNTIRKKELKQVKILVSFYETRYKKGWFSKQEEKVCWEQWILNINCPSPPNPNNNQQPLQPHYPPASYVVKLEEKLSAVMRHILRVTNDNKSHIPPLISKELTPFPYDITISNMSEGWGMLWNMLKSPTPLLNTDYT